MVHYLGKFRRVGKFKFPVLVAESGTSMNRTSISNIIEVNKDVSGQRFYGTCTVHLYALFLETLQRPMYQASSSRKKENTYQ